MIRKEDFNKVRQGIYCCIFGDCQDCPYNVDSDEEDCSYNLLWDALFLIENLKEENEFKSFYCDAFISKLNEIKGDGGKKKP